MAVTSYTLGPGRLLIGPTGTEKDFSCQITGAALVPDKDKEDSVKTLCGDTVAGAVTYTWALEGELVQDELTASSLLKWCKDNAGTEQPFIYEPKIGTGLMSAVGTLVVDPLQVGGDEVGQKPTSEFEFEVLDWDWEDQV